MPFFEKHFRLLIIALLLPFIAVAQPAESLTTEQRVSLLDSALLMEETSRPELAIPFYDKVIYRPDGRLRTDSLTDVGVKNKARVLRRPLRRVEEALATYQERVDWLEAQPDATDAKRLIYYQHLGSVAFFERRYDISRRALRFADNFARRAENPDYLVWVDALRLLCNIAADDYDADLVRSTTRRATAIYEAHKDLDERPLFNLIGREVYLDGADARDRIGDQDVAYEYAYRALEIGEFMGNNAGIIRCLNLVALAEERAKNFAAARAAHQRAIRLYETDPERAGEISYVYNNLAQLDIMLGNYEAGMEAYRKARETMKPYRVAEYLPGILSDMGHLEARRGNHDAADTLYAAAIKMISFGNIRIKDGEGLALTDSVELLHELQAVYESRLETLLETGELRRAMVVADEIIAVQNRLRREVITEGSRNFNSAVIRAALDALVKICYELEEETGDPEYHWRAFTYSERARAYGLMNALQRNQVLLSAAERRLRTRIVALERRAIRDTSAFAELDRARLDLRNMITSSETDTTGGRVSDRNQLLTFLRETETTLVSFHLTDSLSNFVFSLTPAGELTMVKTDSTVRLGRLVKDWRKCIVDGRYRSKSLLSPEAQGRFDAQFARLGDSLARTLFPVLPPEAGRLCIIPDGDLHFLPFGALPLNPPASGPLDYGSLKYLGGAYRLQLAYTTELLLRTGEKEKYDRDFIGMAPSFSGAKDVYALNDLRGNLRGNDVGLPGLQPLENNEAEVIAAAALFADAETHLGPGATRRQFLEVLDRGRILHLSTHGLVDPANRNLSFVAFAQEKDSLYSEDLLYYNDLPLLPLEAELVVLAACETSLGEVAPGETIMSMASAFTAAGAKSTLTSLWQVDDAATKELMVNFYRALTAGKPRAEALATAQLLTRESGEYAHPFYWSGMVLHGEAGAMEFAAGGNVLWWVAGGLAVLALGGLLFGLARGKG